jgi:arabinofuranosyltransferase
MVVGNLNIALLKRWSFYLMWLLLAYYFFRYAWITEDAFINFRVIENFKHGLGLTWNPGERVQVFTSALWMLLSIGASMLTGEEIYSTLLLSFGLVGASFYILYTVCGRALVIFQFACLAFVFSPSFRDYMSSGLETPLLIFSLVVFVRELVRRGEVRVRRLSLIASCCMLVRHDSLVLLLPFLIQAWYGSCAEWRIGNILRVVRDVLIGSLPLILWSFFAIVYFGSPFPNTASAKIVGGFDGVSQALKYFSFMQHFDPLAYILILMALGAAVCFKSRFAWPLGLALGLFVAYQFRVGADYMAGRFFVAPVTLCVFLLAHIIKEQAELLRPQIDVVLATHRREYVLLLVVLGFSFGLRTFVIDNSSFYASDYPAFVDGIVDERQVYFGSSDFETISMVGVRHIFKENARVIDRVNGVNVFLVCNIGMTGFYAHRDTYILDPLALSDRFLSGFDPSPGILRIGHFERAVPSDYVYSLLKGRNMFRNPLLRQYFDDVQLVTRGELFSWARFQAIFRLSSGWYVKRLSGLRASDGGGALRVKSMKASAPKGCLGGGVKAMVPYLYNDHIELKTLERGVFTKV